jgi:DMSO/TMAO reductase YedYZ molybdopterin-dependent catalytic subunit
MPFRAEGEAHRQEQAGRVPPDQKVVDGWPVFTYGSVPRIDLETWQFRIWGEVEEEVTFTWQEFLALPKATVTSDVHCVTQWSKLDNVWEGVAFREVMKHVRLKPDARYVMVHSYGDYTTNIPLADLDDDDVLFAYKHDGKDLTPSHGWPLRLVVPKLYFWKSAKWVRGLHFLSSDRPGFWETHGYHMRGDPWKQERYS